MSSVAPQQPRRSEKSRLAIFEATLELIEESGYDRLTIEGIAARAKVGKQTLYRWWSSKAALVVDVVLSSDGIFVWPGRTADRSAEQDLRAWTTEMVRAYTTEPRVSMMKAITMAMSEDPKVAQRVHDRVGAQALEQLTSLLQEVVPEGDPADVALAAEMFEGAFIYRSGTTPQPVSEEFGQAVLEMLLRGLRARSD
jgi:AcrR family transcriptional regulator